MGVGISYERGTPAQCSYRGDSKLRAHITNGDLDLE